MSTSNTNNFTENKIKFAALLLAMISITVRIYSFKFSNFDMDNFNLKWYQAIVDGGVAGTLGTNFTNYSPFYTYLLALASLTNDFIDPLIGIKLIPTFFDFITAYTIYKIVRIKHPNGAIPYLATAVYFSAPTIIINSSYWGQVDSVYTCFLLIALFYLLKERSFLAMVAFGISFSIKAQAFFFVPFLVILIFQKKLSWSLILIIPVVYLISALPVVLLGRNITEVLLVYFQQAGSYKILSINSPNLYIFFSRENYSAIMPIGLILAGLVTVCWIYSSYKAKFLTESSHKVLLAVISTAITVFLLPKMHDRYLYPTDVLSILLAFYKPELWIIPILYQFISFAATSLFLFDTNRNFLIVALLVNMFAIAFLIKAQKENGLIYQNISSAFIRTACKWLFILLMPVTIFGIGIYSLATPIFYKAEYRLNRIPNDAESLDYQERIQAFNRISEYLNGNIKTEDLHRKKLAGNELIFSKYEAYYMQDVRFFWQKVTHIWGIVLLTMYSICLISWAIHQFSVLKSAALLGGWLTAILASLIGLTIIIIGIFQIKTESVTHLLPIEKGILYNLFTAQLISDFLTVLLTFVFFTGILLGSILRKYSNEYT